jgi:hypothetical protein
MHDAGETRRLALEIRIVLLEVVSGAFLLALGSEPKSPNLSAQEDPDSIQIGAFTGRLRKSGPRNQQRHCRCEPH